MFYLHVVIMMWMCKFGIDCGVENQMFDMVVKKTAANTIYKVDRWKNIVNDTWLPWVSYSKQYGQRYLRQWLLRGFNFRTLSKICVCVKISRWCSTSSATKVTSAVATLFHIYYARLCAYTRTAWRTTIFTNGHRP